MWLGDLARVPNPIGGSRCWAPTRPPHRARIHRLEPAPCPVAFTSHPRASWTDQHTPNIPTAPHCAQSSHTGGAPECCRAGALLVGAIHSHQRSLPCAVRTPRGAAPGLGTRPVRPQFHCSPCQCPGSPGNGRPWGTGTGGDGRRPHWPAAGGLKATGEAVTDGLPYLRRPALADGWSLSPPNRGPQQGTTGGEEAARRWVCRWVLRPPP